MLKFLLSIIVSTSFSSFAQIDEVRRITKSLCSPEFYGRGYYKKGDSLAADYLVDEFKKLGIEGYNGTVLQPFEIQSVNTFPGRMIVNNGSFSLNPGVHFVVDPSSSGFVGELRPFRLTPKMLFDREGLSKIIRDIRNEKTDRNSVVLDLIDLDLDTLKQLSGISQALAAYCHVIEITDEKFTWSVGTEQLPNALIKIQDPIYSGGPLNVEIDAQLLNNYMSQNVIAYLPGKKKCTKTILFTAHYDHLGHMGSNTYFPGANDNASGTAMLFTMAKYFKENPSDYNVMFIAFAGEEAGLLGSKYFVENPILKLKKIKFLVNLDIMGSGEDGITAVNATVFEKEFELLQRINEEKKLLTKVKRRGPSANSDHYWFTEKGVPAFFIYTMGPNKHYHDIFDTYEELSFREYDDITDLLITFVRRLN
jgi:aminopeptidase YwaD